MRRHTLVARSSLFWFRHMARVVLFVALLLLQSDGAISQFAPGWNGKAKTPPMVYFGSPAETLQGYDSLMFAHAAQGWRSWNAFAAYINHSIIEKNIVALTSPGWNVPGKQELVSLASLGYVEFGIDEGWERCNKTTDVPGAMQHNDAGDPIVNTTRFPNLAVLVDAGHAAGLNIILYYYIILLQILQILQTLQILQQILQILHILQIKYDILIGTRQA
eukprot:SAG31_NODE_2184_length_6244_cov_3.004882_1_plen_219_part_00